MRYLYIFPHPDDESFGPVAAMSMQLRQGHEVHLLTLTKGEATRQREKLGLTKTQMAEVRHNEMLAVEKAVGLTSMTVLDLPDGELAELDPRKLEAVVRDHIKRVEPDVVVSYPVHGISGFHDHLVAHAVVKRVYLDLRDSGGPCPRRLAMYTIPDRDGPVFIPQGIRIRHSAPERIDCLIEVTDADVAKMKEALACYVSYQDTIAQSGVAEKVGRTLCFELYGEEHRPALADLAHGL